MNKKLFWFAASLYSVVALSNGFIALRGGVSGSSALAEGLISGLCVVVFSVLGILIVKAYPTKMGVAFYAMIIGILMGYGAWQSSLYLLSWVNGDAAFYTDWLRQTTDIRYVLFLILHCWFMTIAAFEHKNEVLEEELRNLSDAATLHREAELFKLRQQLQPHFLYNSLNSINALVLRQPDQAQEMIGRLSDFLRDSVRREGREAISVDEELAYIRSYLAIETIRFGHRLHVEIQKKTDDPALVPPFLLQPVLENAVKFGIYGKTGDVFIQLVISREKSLLILQVSNPFDPGEKPPKGTGFGLHGIRRRLYLLFGRTDLLTVQEWGSVFTTTIKIPQEYAQNIDH